jgi:hypothetical protein
MSRIQFQSGRSLNDLLEEYGEEEQCSEVLENAYWAQGFVRPASFCRAMLGRVNTFQFNRDHKQVTLTGGTIFLSTKLPLNIWLQAIYFLSQTHTAYPRWS